MKIAIVGGGPAGLRAAEIASEAGAQVTLFDAKASVGRKFLVAGRGGLNLSKAEPPALFASRYSSGEWTEKIADFDLPALQSWAESLGVETFVAATGRVYPRELKAAPLLRRWLSRLRERGVQFAPRHRWVGLERGKPLRLRFEDPAGDRWIEADAAILALGGGSWPQTGSDGAWTKVLDRLGVAVTPLEPANCGWETEWSPEVLAVAEGQPLKSLSLRAGASEAKGELLVTRYGLEGGALYQLGATLRRMPEPMITIDFKPSVPAERLVARLGLIRRDFLAEARHRWRLSPAVIALLAEHEPFASAEALAAKVKAFAIPLRRPRPLDEAISSTGGLSWEELDSELMLRRLPGVFAAGEMIDWEAPTGGYLIHGCLALGTCAARSALRWLERERIAASDS